ncbi:hypothetical protein CQ020_20690 [Arthrobacter sp. MYb23]|uniref:ThiF family adenylyltransferase n=1 Tax=unclassified Arthrobacter TaxID=235627 RepID=UPI000CFCB032|nr:MULTISPECIES: ThiF family adenylyltransferase [unclassified Arthrobacter]PRB38504.1 hypothetical protein CQ038_19875 [Arthrobacter sp. MYb51]PRB91466.1 hypothetical protein CQ020_20690 [Arthrobacter sp. MYb23]
MFHYEFHPAKTVTFDEETLTIEDEYSRRTVALLQHDATASLLHAAMTDPSTADAAMRRLLNALVERHVIIERHPHVEMDERQSRSLGYLATRSKAPQLAQQQIGNQCVLVLGVGGTGTVLIQHLVAAGVRRFVLVDHDAVELSNFNRQFLWRTSDVGAAKLETTKAWISERVEDPDIQTVDRRISSESDVSLVLGEYPSVTVVASCIDSPAGIEQQVVAACLSAGLPVMTGAVGVDLGHVGPFFSPRQKVCLACWYGSRAAKQAVTPWSHGVTNTLVGALMAQRVLDWAMDPDTDGEPTRMTVEFNSLTIHRSLARDCAHHDA